MKFRRSRVAGKSRAGVLALVCAAVFASYAVGRFQETGEIIFLKWGRKALASTNSPSGPLKNPFVRIYDQMDSTEESTTGPDATRSLSVSTQRNEIVPREGNGTSGTAETRLDNWQRSRVVVPTNAVWSQSKPRKGPGIRIAFP